MAGVPGVLRAKGSGELCVFDVDANEYCQERDEHLGEHAKPAVEGNPGTEEGDQTASADLGSSDGRLALRPVSPASGQPCVRSARPGSTRPRW